MGCGGTGRWDIDLAAAGAAAAQAAAAATAARSPMTYFLDKWIIYSRFSPGLGPSWCRPFFA